MLRFLLRFWPVLLPLLIYIIWMIVTRRRARRFGTAAPDFRDGPWYWAALASLLIGMACLLLLGADSPASKGAYVPPSLVNGEVISGHSKEQP